MKASRLRRNSSKHTLVISNSNWVTPVCDLAMVRHGAWGMTGLPNGGYPVMDNFETVNNRFEFYNHNPLYKQFRVVLLPIKYPRRHLMVIVNEDSKYKDVVALGDILQDEVLDNMDVINYFCGSPKERKIVFMGTDLQRRLGQYVMTSRFSKIFIENKPDTGYDWATAFPGFFNYSYASKYNVEFLTSIMNQEKSIEKRKLVGSGFGFGGPLSKIADRVEAKQFENNNKHWVQCINCPPEDYLQCISECKFMICPQGTGIQCTKIYECLLLETIPVVTRHATTIDLKRYHKLPLLVVDKWSDIRPGKLIAIYKNHFANLNWQKIRESFKVNNCLDTYLK